MSLLKFGVWCCYRRIFRIVLVPFGISFILKINWKLSGIFFDRRHNFFNNYEICECRMPLRRNWNNFSIWITIDSDQSTQDQMWTDIFYFLWNRTKWAKRRKTNFVFFQVCFMIEINTVNWSNSYLLKALMNNLYFEVWKKERETSWRAEA